MIRVTVTQVGQVAKIREYADAAEAQKWLIEDSYFTNDSVREVVWENVPECEHRWIEARTDAEFLYLECDLECGRKVRFEHSRLSRFARVMQR